MMKGDCLRDGFLFFEFDLDSCTGFVLAFLGVLDLEDLKLYLEFLDYVLMLNLDCCNSSRSVSNCFTYDSVFLSFDFS